MWIDKQERFGKIIFYPPNDVRVHLRMDGDRDGSRFPALPFFPVDNAGKCRGDRQLITLQVNVFCTSLPVPQMACSPVI